MNTPAGTAVRSKSKAQIGSLAFYKTTDFRFDTGAHRFHDKDPQVTEEVKNLLGDDLLQVAAPSEIFFEGEFYRFPLLLSDLVEKLEAKTLLRIAWEKLYNRPKKTGRKLCNICDQPVRKNARRTLFTQLF